MHRIWVTRDEMPDGPLCRALRDAGLEPVCEPVVARRVVMDVSAQVGSLQPEDWLVLTSVFAIEQVPAEAVKCRVAVVGESSRRVAEGCGFRVELVSDDGTGQTLWRMLAGVVGAAQRICFPRSSLAAMPTEIAGVTVEAPVLYETMPRAFNRARVADVAGAAVASPSAARVLGGLREAPRCASIGPTTSDALRAVGIEPWMEAREKSFDALAEAIADALREIDQH